MKEKYLDYISRCTLSGTLFGAGYATTKISTMPNPTPEEEVHEFLMVVGCCALLGLLQGVLASLLLKATSYCSEDEADSGNEMDRDLQDFIGSFDEAAEPFTDAVRRLEIDVRPEDNLLCPISRAVPDIPVRVGGTLFDWNWLSRLPIQEDGRLINPLTQRPFRLDQIQPDRECRDRIASLIQAKGDALYGLD